MDGFDGDMRDMLGFASHVEVCGIAGICGICGICGTCGICGIFGTDHLLEITPAGLPFLGPPPPNPRRAENGNGKQPAIQKKRMLIFDLTCCLSII